MKIWTGLNFLRGVGVCMIVIHHANIDVIPDLPVAKGLAGYIVWRIRNLGWSGIDLFLVLSGFLMGATLLTEIGKRGRIDLKRYWTKRAQRILPSYYFLLLVLGVTGASGYIVYSSSFDTVRSTLTHFLFLNNYLDQEPNGPTWYLAAIVQFYLLVPAFLAVILHRRKKWITGSFVRFALIVVGITVALRVLRVLTGTHQPNDFMLTPFRTDSIFIGMLCFHLLARRHAVARYVAERPLFFMAVAFLLIAPSAYLPRKNPFMFSLGFTMLACGYGVIIILLAQNAFQAVTRKLSCFVVLAGWSYNIYLWHYFLPSLMGKYYTEFQVWMNSMIPYIPLALFCAISAYVSISIFVGYCMTVLIERPAQKILVRPR